MAARSGASSVSAIWRARRSSVRAMSASSIRRALTRSVMPERYGAGPDRCRSARRALPEQVQRLDAVAQMRNDDRPADDDPDVSASVREWEPGDALFAGADGLDAIRRIVADARGWLQPGGWMLLEIGHRQANPVGELLRAAGLQDVTVERDLSGRDRFAVARRSPG